MSQSTTPEPEHSPARRRRAIPNFVRLDDLAAFMLGFAPFDLWYSFCRHESVASDESCKRWLRDAPALLGRFLTPYAVQRFVATLEELLELFRARPVETSEDCPFSSRLEYLYHLLFDSSDDHPAAALVWLAVGLSHSLPETVRRWFELGAAIGSYLSVLEPFDCVARPQMIAEIVRAFGQTDYPADSRIALDWRHFVGDADDGGVEAIEVEETAQAVYSPEYVAWAFRQIKDFVSDLRERLNRLPHVGLDKRHRNLWFQGVRVQLTENECKVFATIAESTEPITARGQILIAAGMNENTDENWVDKMIQQIINKIVAALEKVGEPRFRHDNEQTRRWLRDEFLPSQHGIGWRHGSLMDNIDIVD